MKDEIIVEIEDYNGNTIGILNLLHFEMADQETDNHYRFQSTQEIER